MIINKYMKRGLVLLVAGILLNLAGVSIMNQEHFDSQKLVYGSLMTVGVVCFGAGFLLILYSLMRKVERHSILEDRAGAEES